jgi:hypothetical protein
MAEDQSFAQKFFGLLEIIIIITVVSLIVNAIREYMEYQAKLDSPWEYAHDSYSSIKFAKDKSAAFDKSVGKMTEGVLNNKNSGMTAIFAGNNAINKGIGRTMNSVRNLTYPIRAAYRNNTKFIYDRINNFTLGVMYMLHKMRTALKRSIGGFHLLVHTLETTKLSFESLLNSPIPRIAKSLVGDQGAGGERGRDAVGKFGRFRRRGKSVQFQK